MGIYDNLITSAIVPFKIRQQTVWMESKDLELDSTRLGAARPDSFNRTLAVISSHVSCGAKCFLNSENKAPQRNATRRANEDDELDEARKY